MYATTSDHDRPGSAAHKSGRRHSRRRSQSQNHCDDDRRGISRKSRFRNTASMERGAAPGDRRHDNTVDVDVDNEDGDGTLCWNGQPVLSENEHSDIGHGIIQPIPSLHISIRLKISIHWFVSIGLNPLVCIHWFVSIGLNL